jgi:hypothetical protein
VYVSLSSQYLFERLKIRRWRRRKKFFRGQFFYFTHNYTSSFGTWLAREKKRYTPKNKVRPSNLVIAEKLLNFVKQPRSMFFKLSACLPAYFHFNFFYSIFFFFSIFVNSCAHTYVTKRWDQQEERCLLKKNCIKKIIQINFVYIAARHKKWNTSKTRKKEYRRARERKKLKIMVLWPEASNNGNCFPKIEKFISQQPSIALAIKFIIYNFCT